MRMLDAALGLAAQGWAVFPSRPGQKLPLIKSWPDAATSDADQVREWWQRWPDANLSHVPGRSGSFVLDLDGPQGFESWRQLQRVHGRAPATLAVLSPRVEGGAHLYWSAPDFYIKSVAGRIGTTPVEGIDVRGSRGQAVLPPSVRSDGTTYRWADPEATVAEPPPWLVALLRPRPVAATGQRVGQFTGTAAGRLSGLVRTVAQAPDGQLNDTLHWAACRGGELAAEHGDAQAVAAALLDAAAAAGHPSSGAWRTIQSGMRKADVHIGGEVA